MDSPFLHAVLIYFAPFYSFLLSVHTSYRVDIPYPYLLSLSPLPSSPPPPSLPQLVMLTFDDAVSVANYKYTEEIMLGRTNPDGCSAAATFFVSHEYTDYSKVHALWSEGHEIALHSIRYVHTSCSSSFLILSRRIPVCIGLEISLGNAPA